MRGLGGSGAGQPWGRRNPISLVCWIAVACILMVALISACAGAIDAPDVLTIPYPYSEPLYPLTDFEHGKHSLLYTDARDERLRCVACHHKWNEASRDPPPPCADCHTEFGDDIGTLRLTDAHHIRCTMCHREVMAAGRAAGPIVECFECHIIEEPPATQ